MFVRACCLSGVVVTLAAGCQSTPTALFPWSDESSVPSLTEAELQRSRNAMQLEKDSFAEPIRMVNTPENTSGTAPNESQDSDRSQRVISWLRRGQDAIRRSSETAQPDAMLAEATQSFREVLRVDPDNADAWHGLAIVSDLNEDWDVADMSYKRALAMRPDDVNLLNDQGYSYVLQNRYHEAAQYLNRALEISPAHEKAHINLAILDIRRGHADSALQRLSQVYPAGQAQAALASLAQEHGAADDDVMPLNQPVPQSATHGLIAGNGNPHSVPVHTVNSPAPHGGTPPTAMSFRQPGHQQMPGAQPLVSQPSASQVPATQPPVAQMNVTQSQVTQSQMSQSPLFSQSGVIRAPSEPSSVRPAAATGTGRPSGQISPATMQRPAGATAPVPATASSSPLDSARQVGGTLQMPANWNSIRPQLPASANVYRPAGQPSAAYVQPPVQNGAPHQAPPTFGTQPAIHGGPLTGQPTAVPFPQGQYSPSQLPAHQTAPAQPSAGFSGQPGFAAQQYAGQPVSILPGEMNAGPPVRTMQSADGRPVSVPPATSGTPAAAGANGVTPNGSFYGNPPISIDPRQPALQTTIKPGYTTSSQTNWQTPHGASQPMDAVSSHGVPGVNQAGWSQPVPPAYNQPGMMAPQPAGAAGMPPTGQPNPQPAAQPSLGPPYFSPPPVMGNGYTEPAATVTPARDPLSEYRATRQQLDSGYNRTLQRLGQPSGSSFQ